MDCLYVILFVCYGSYVYNRKSVSLALPSLIEQGMDTSYAGLILSCENLAYAVSKFYAGILSDRLNPQLMFASGLLISGAATILFASSSSLIVFCGLWFLNGLAQGCGWPACAKILRQKASPSQFGTLWSILSSSYNMAGSISPFLSAFIILNFGWRLSVLVAGGLSVLLGILLFTLHLSNNFYSCPAQKIVKVSEEKSNGSENKQNFYDLLFDPFLWLVFTGFMIVVCAKTAVVVWGGIYLMKERNHSQYAASAYVSSVESGGFLGRIFAGYLTDMVVKRKLRQANSPEEVHRVNLRMSVAVLFMLGSLMSMHFFQYAAAESSSIIWLTVLGIFMGVCYYGPIAIFGIVSAESAPSHLSGSSNAVTSLGANIGAVVSGLPMSYIAKHSSWSTVFIILEMATAAVIFTMFCCRNLRPSLMGRENKKRL